MYLFKLGWWSSYLKLNTMLKEACFPTQTFSIFLFESMRSKRSGYMPYIYIHLYICICRYIQNIKKSWLGRIDVKLISSMASFFLYHGNMLGSIVHFICLLMLLWVRRSRRIEKHTYLCRVLWRDCIVIACLLSSLKLWCFFYSYSIRAGVFEIHAYTHTPATS